MKYIIRGTSDEVQEPQLTVFLGTYFDEPTIMGVGAAGRTFPIVGRLCPQIEPAPRVVGQEP